jgi:phage repressor protein C with HTH and peptisase S24 domain
MLEMLAGRSQSEVAELAGVSIATWQRTVSGSREPSITELGRLRPVITPAGFQTLVNLIIGEVADSGIDMPSDRAAEKKLSDTIAVPVHDIQVAAGAGKVADRLDDPIFHFDFSRQWFESNLVGIRNSIMVYVAGSSQEPELSDGDLVLVDLDQNRLREGLFVVRLDDHMVIKHVQIEGKTVRLVSRNTLFDPVVIDLSEPNIEDSFEIVGRAIWAGKML